MKITFAIISLIASSTASAASFSNACEAGENWNIELQQKSNWVGRFKVFLTKQESPWLAFSEAIQLKKISNLMKNGDFEADFAEYWVGRIFYDLELYPLAHTFFNSSKENSRFPEIKNASAACLRLSYKKIPDWNPAMGLTMTVENALLKKGLETVKKRDYPAAIKILNEFLIESTPLGIANRSEYRDLAHLLLGRSLYSVGRFSEAINAFQKVDKRSNLEIDAMGDLAWAYLLSERYAEALGVALQLRSGSLKNTFAPESVMIAAMALNETCSYPDAVRMIQAFIQDYEQPFQWLLRDHSKDNLYQEILLGLKKQSTVPIKIRTEWTKSAAFMVRQAEINLLIENSRKISGIPAKIKTFQHDLALKNVKVLKTLIHDLRIADLQKTVDPAISQRLLSAKKEIRRVIRFNQASKIMMAVVKKYDATIPTEKEKLVKKVTKDLQQRNKDMLSLLKRVRENVDLIEVEVYNGASRDLARIESSQKREPATAPKFENALAWSWGRFAAADIEHQEIWEDEMGALKANIINHCQ
jgi:tetratricopeptide (TPR) repeat protein